MYVNQKIKYNKPSDDIIAYVSNILTHDKLEEMTGNAKVEFQYALQSIRKRSFGNSKRNIENSELEDFTEVN
jgi:hypothetical protein